MNHDFYSPEADLVDQLSVGLSNNLLALFDERTKRWRYPMMHCEGFTIGLFDDLVHKISKIRAFELIPKAIDISLFQKDPDLFLTALSLLSTLVSASHTTEIPLTLQIKLSELSEKVSNIPNNKKASESLEEVHKWYRLV